VRDSSGDDRLKRELAEAFRQIREEARQHPQEAARLPTEAPAASEPAPLAALPKPPVPEAPSSPDRRLLNERWNVGEALAAPPSGRLGRGLGFLRPALQRLARFALGPLVERQVELNSAQVRFDNEIVSYLDDRLERLTAHYDRVLGLHGKRMEEIDERHLILQQELVRHVHELVKRIEFVFENAEQNHLYLEGALRELRDEVRSLAAMIESLPLVEKERR
jgi:hypothetical protein